MRHHRARLDDRVAHRGDERGSPAGWSVPGGSHVGSLNGLARGAADGHRDAASSTTGWRARRPPLSAGAGFVASHVTAAPKPRRGPRERAVAPARRAERRGAPAAGAVRRRSGGGHLARRRARARRAVRAAPPCARAAAAYARAASARVMAAAARIGARAYRGAVTARRARRRRRRRRRGGRWPRGPCRRSGR